jgi:signal transduction histidine kinase
MLRSLRARTTALAALVVGVVLVFTALALVSSQRNILTDGLDESLTAEVEDLASSVAEIAGGVETTLDVQIDDDAVAQVVADDGEVLAGTRNIGGGPALTAAADATAATTVRSARVLDSDYRLASTRVDGRVVLVGAPVDDIEESISALRFGLVVAVPLVVLALGGLVWWLTGRVLEPVESIRREVADISSRSLHRRVPEPDSGDEIERLARTMNEMLDRLQAAAEHQQQFVADASHELRSPLTRIRAELEVDLEHPGTADLAATHRSVLEEVDRMQQMIDDLLALARLDEHRPPAFGTVALDDLVRAEVANLRATPTVRFHPNGGGAATIRGDAAQLRRVVRNLLDNAARHADRQITVDLERVDDRLTLQVSDDGPGVPATQRESVFDRFTRIDEARNLGDGGSGLGLAIAREIVHAHGGTISIGEARHGGARVVVELPAHDDS